MTLKGPITIYDLSLNVRVGWQAHSISNAGNDGSNRLMPRRQLLASGRETDACSGNILKHHHAVLLAEYLEAAGIPLCPACSTRDGRRAAALIERPDYKDLTIERILNECGLCDAHGFLVTAKHAEGESGEARQPLKKDTIVEFSFALALPDQRQESAHLLARSGDSKEEGQMLMKVSARSGEYALSVRYGSVGVGMDTRRWKMVVTEERQRQQRHKAILSALRDGILCPEGAMSATMRPHLTSLMGAIVIRSTVGRAPTYSALVDDFMTRLDAMKSETCLVWLFETVDAFNQLMDDLIHASQPSLPPAYHAHHEGRTLS
jgi:CRISPR-associated autoregulator DevR family